MALRRAAIGAFYLGIVLLLALALMPGDVAPVLAGDKLQHFVSFLALGILGFGWVSRRSFVMFAGLVALGGAIEVLQPLSLFGREADLVDWLADVAGVVAALVVVTTVQGLSGKPKVPG